MRRLVIGSIVALGAMAVFTSTAVAQKRDTTTTGEDIGQVIDRTRFEVRAGGGVTFPLSSDYYDTGWHLGGALRATPSGFPVAFQLDAFYHDMSEKNDTGIPSDLLDSSFLQLTLDAVLPLKTASKTFDPYILGGVGIYDGSFGVNAGAGVDFRLGFIPAALFIEGRFHRIFTDPEDVSLFPVTLGVRIPL
jgi:hypothetical protein